MAISFNLDFRQTPQQRAQEEQSRFQESIRVRGEQQGLTPQEIGQISLTAQVDPAAAAKQFSDIVGQQQKLGVAKSGSFIQDVLRSGGAGPDFVSRLAQLRPPAPAQLDPSLTQQEVFDVRRLEAEGRQSTSELAEAAALPSEALQAQTGLTAIRQQLDQPSAKEQVVDLLRFSGSTDQEQTLQQIAQQGDTPELRQVAAQMLQQGTVDIDTGPDVRAIIKNDPIYQQLDAAGKLDEVNARIQEIVKGGKPSSVPSVGAETELAAALVLGPGKSFRDATTPEELRQIETKRNELVRAKSFERTLGAGEARIETAEELAFNASVGRGRGINETISEREVLIRQARLKVLNDPENIKANLSRLTQELTVRRNEGKVPIATQEVVAFYEETISDLDRLLTEFTPVERKRFVGIFRNRIATGQQLFSPGGDRRFALFASILGFARQAVFASGGKNLTKIEKEVVELAIPTGRENSFADFEEKLQNAKAHFLRLRDRRVRFAKTGLGDFGKDPVNIQTPSLAPVATDSTQAVTPIQQPTTAEEFLQSFGQGQ